MPGRNLNCARGIECLPWKQYLSGFRFGIDTAVVYKVPM